MGETMMVMIVVAFVVAMLIGFWRVGCWYFEYHARYWLDENGTDPDYFRGMTLPDKLALRNRRAARLWGTTLSYTWSMAWTAYWLIDARTSSESIAGREWTLWFVPLLAGLVWWMWWTCRREYRTMRAVHASYLENVAVLSRS